MRIMSILASPHHESQFLIATMALLLESALIYETTCIRDVASNDSGQTVDKWPIRNGVEWTNRSSNTGHAFPPARFDVQTLTYLICRVRTFGDNSVGSGEAERYHNIKISELSHLKLLCTPKSPRIWHALNESMSRANWLREQSTGEQTAPHTGGGPKIGRS